MSYETKYGYQGVDGIMQDFGIQSFSDFATEQEVNEYFTVENINSMFGTNQEDEWNIFELDEIRDEFLREWREQM